MCLKSLQVTKNQFRLSPVEECSMIKHVTPQS